MSMIVKEKYAYLDTCVVSGLAKGDLDDREAESMLALLNSTDNDSYIFVTSSVALAELKRIPKKHQTPHLAVYHLLEKVRALPEPSITRLGLYGGPASNPDRWIWERLKSLMPDEMDANHIYQAIQNGVKYFVTVDVATILRFKSAIDKEFSLAACKPSELFQIAGHGVKNDPIP